MTFFHAYDSDQWTQIIRHGAFAGGQDQAGRGQWGWETWGEKRDIRKTANNKELKRKNLLLTYSS